VSVAHGFVEPCDPGRELGPWRSVLIRINKCSFISVSAQGITNTGTRIFNWKKGENKYARATLSERLLGK
jgi:hypothetical protein